MKCSLGISNFLDEISRLSYSIAERIMKRELRNWITQNTAQKDKVIENMNEKLNYIEDRVREFQ